MNLQKLADQLLPFLLPLLKSSAAQSGSGSGPLAQHQLSGSLHVGTLADEQAPQFLKTDGSRGLTGNLNVAPGVMIDGVDISAHAGDPAAHHAPATAGDGLSISGQQLSLTTPGTLSATSANNAAGNHTHAILTAAATTLTANTSNTAGSSASLARADHTHAISTGIPVALSVSTTNAAGSSAGLARADHTHNIITSSNPGTSPAILASDASGSLTLVSLTATSKLRSPLLDTASGALTLAPASDLILNPGSGIVRLGTGDAIQSDGYASQTTGWRISGAGEADFRYLFVDEMHAKSFIADLEQALAGGQIISKSVTVLAVAFTAPAAGGTATLRVRDLPSAPNMPVFQPGDIVRLRKFSRANGNLTIADCWGTVSNYADQADGTQTWTFTRSASPNAGSMAAGTVVAPDSLVLDYGVSGNGFYEVNAIDGTYGLNSPYAQVVSWTTHPATGQTVRARLGNLSGIFGTNNEYGLFAGNGTSIDDPHLRISNTGVGLYNLPLRMFTGGTERVHIASHDDVWIGPSPSDKRLIWDGSTLTVTGTINVLGGNAAKTDLSNSVISTLISGSSIRVGSGTKDVNLNGWNIDSTEIVGQKNGEDQVVFDTNGQIIAGSGLAAINKYGYLFEESPTIDQSWPFFVGGLHAVGDINNPETTYLGSLIYGLTAQGAWIETPKGWYFRYANALPQHQYPNQPSWDTALMIQDGTGETVKVFHEKNLDDLDDRYINAAGDTMTGTLTVNRLMQAPGSIAFLGDNFVDSYLQAEDILFDILQARPPSSAEQWNGSSWTSIDASVFQSLFRGGGFLGSYTISNGAGAIRLKWNNIPYTYFQNLVVYCSTQGNGLSIKCETGNGSAWTERFVTSSHSTWPGWIMRRGYFNNSGQTPYLRLTFQPTWNNTNPITLYYVRYFCTYNVFEKRTPFSWDVDRVVSFVQTPKVNNETVWHSGNDGAGSGLDADMLDGYHAADFVKPSDNLGSWISLSLASPWTNWGSGWATAAYCTFGDWVLIRGLVKPTTNVAANSTIATLPTVARPTQKRRFFTSNSATSSNANMAELDIYTSGAIVIRKPVSANYPVSIECMFKK